MDAGSRKPSLLCDSLCPSVLSVPPFLNHADTPHRSPVSPIAITQRSDAPNRLHSLAGTPGFCYRC